MNSHIINAASITSDQKKDPKEDRKEGFPQEITGPEKA